MQTFKIERGIRFTERYDTQAELFPKSGREKRRERRKKVKNVLK